MSDVGEGLWNCDIGLFEGTRLGKGFWYDDEVCCWEGNFGIGGADRWVPKYYIYIYVYIYIKLLFKFK